MQLITPSFRKTMKWTAVFNVDTLKIEFGYLSECSNSNLTHTYKIWRQVMFIKLKSGMKQIGNKTGNQYFLSQFIICHSSLATGHLHSPFIHVCYNTDSFCYWFIQHWMLERKEEFIGKWANKVFIDNANWMRQGKDIKHKKNKRMLSYDSNCQSL